MENAIPNIVVIIPAYNEEDAVGKVIQDIPKKWVNKIIVVNNNSNDDTKTKAMEAGAIVVDEPIHGYGIACLSGIEYANSLIPRPEIIVFMDGDYSDHPEELPLLIKPILENDLDMVIGSRALGNRERGAMTVQQIFGNWLATFLIRLFYGVRYTDLGPFRAIKFEKLIELEMQDKTYGWTVEMQLKVSEATEMII